MTWSWLWVIDIHQPSSAAQSAEHDHGLDLQTAASTAAALGIKKYQDLKKLSRA